MRLWFACRFPDLPYIALEHQCVADSYVVVEKQRVIWSNSLATAGGAEYHMDITTAQLLTDCDFLERDKALEEKFLAAWTEKLYQFSPHIYCYSCASLPHAGLLLEVSTCLKLFGGVLALRAQLLDVVSDDNINVSLGIAHTKNAAWLMTFADIVNTGDEMRDDFIQLLCSLSIELLHDHPASVDALYKMGFNTLADVVRQIERQTIAGIKKRFGAAFTTYLCELFDIDIDFNQPSLFSQPVPTHAPVEIFCETLEFEFPTSNTKFMEYPVENLLHKLTSYLRKRQLETQQIKWTLSDIHRSQEHIVVFADSPQNEWKLFYDLTIIQLEHREFSGEVDVIRLVCDHTSRVQHRATVLAFDNKKSNRSYEQDFALTAAKLKARLGDHAVYKLSYQDVLIPEESQKEIALNEHCNQALPVGLTDAPRPSWLLPEAMPIEERAKGLYWRGYLTVLTGPERIHGNWLDEVIARDYFMALRHDHVRLWIYKELTTHTWFVHGIFG